MGTARSMTWQRAVKLGCIGSHEVTIPCPGWLSTYTTGRAKDERTRTANKQSGGACYGEV
jgi:hypothetical protein